MAAPSSEPSRVGSRGRRRWPVGSTAPEATHIHSRGVMPASCPVASPLRRYIPVRGTCRSSLLSFSPALRRSAAGPRRPETLSLPSPFSDDPAMDHAGGSSFGGGGGAPERNWPQSLDKPLTHELFNFGLLVPPGCRLAKPWRICKDGYPTLTNPATQSSSGPPAREYEVPPEQFVLREDGDPDDSPGLLVAMRASQATAVAATREEAEIAATIQATAAAAANPPPDDDVDWDALTDSFDDDDGDGDGAVDGPAVVYLDSD
ncbi:hypothetical protein ZWY2020_018203 [Hordeum vulgare]|nr:hypothetical protein ZWY2020_018203 [Hordeum vulgare]